MWLTKFNEMRKESGMNLDELSEKSGVPKGTLSKITSGITKNPSLETMRDLVYAMGYTLNDLDSDSLKSSDGISDEKSQVHPLVKIYNSLNLEGQEKLMDYATDLSSMEKYKKCDSISKAI